MSRTRRKNCLDKSLETHLKDVRGQYMPNRWWTYRSHIGKRLDEVIETEIDFYRRLSRDGATAYETPLNTGFKDQAKRHLRRRNKTFCQNVMMDDWEDSAYPIRKEGKAFAWDWW